MNKIAYSVVNDFKPENASCAIREILLFDKSIRFNRLKLANAFDVISVIKFCSRRLKKKSYRYLRNKSLHNLMKMTEIHFEPCNSYCNYYFDGFSNVWHNLQFSCIFR